MHDDHDHAPDLRSEDGPTSPWLDRVNDAYYDRLGKIAGRRTRDRINWMCAQCKGKTVLDIGCSQGITSILLARESFRVLGIDIMAPAIEYAKRELLAEPDEVRARADFERIDLLSMAVGEGFDNVVLGEVIEHQTLPERFITAAARHVRPGGRLIVTVPFGLHPFPDHKCTIFPRHLSDALGDEFQYAWLDVADGYIRIIATRGASADARQIQASDLLDVTQGETIRIQEQHYASLQAIRALKADKKELQAGLAKAKERADALDLQLERLKMQSLALRTDSLRLEQQAERVGLLLDRSNQELAKFQTLRADSLRLEQQAKQAGLLLERSNQELAKLRTESKRQILAERKRSGELQIAKTGHRAANRQLEAIRGSRSFLAGNAFAMATKSPRDFFALPARLFRALAGRQSAGRAQ